MTKTFTSMQWNIGAGKIRKHNTDPLAAASYSIDGLNHVIEIMGLENPDIITLQEVHFDGRYNQVETIATKLGYKYYVSDFYSESHIEPGQQLGQGIISRFPLSEHTTKTFENPLFEVTWKDGTTATTHDKGLTSCTLDIEGVRLTVMTLHLMPFDPFKVDPRSDSAKRIFTDVESKLVVPNEPLLIQGDLNLGHTNPPVAELMPGLTSVGVEELIIKMPTIPDGEWPDRILNRGLSVRDVKVFDHVLTDHYPLLVTFEY